MNTNNYLDDLFFALVQGGAMEVEDLILISYLSPFLSSLLI